MGRSVYEVSYCRKRAIPPVRSGGNLPPYLLRIRRMLRSKATKMRSHRRSGLQAAKGAAYTQNTALYAATFRIRNPHGGVDAAATENAHAVLLSRGRCVYAMFMAAGCRRYGWAQGRCFYMVFSAYTLRPWRQVAAATNERGVVAPGRIFLRICDENGGLEGRRIGGAKLHPVILSLSLPGILFLIRTPLPSRARALCPCSRTGRSS